jgi:sec-independent protein translocase protein TatC
MSGDDDRRMTIVEHLEELRRVVIIAGGAWLLCTVAAFFFNSFLLGLLLRPLKQVTQNSNNHLLDGQAIFTSPTEGLTVPLKVAAIAGFIVALPIILWQIWTFVSPGLRPVERRFAGPFLASALLLFAAGGGFAYFVMPVGLNFLATFLNGNAVYFPDINEYLSFFILLIVVFGVTFELPVVIVLLGLLGIVSSRTLRRRRKAAWILIIIAANLVTPGADPFTPLFLAIPLLVLFELSILVLDKALKR